jgi:hypothetical protein
MTLELHILRLLAAARGKLTPEITIRMDLRQAVVPAPTLSDTNAALRAIEDRNLAVSMRDDLGDQVRWRITDQGKAELAERGLL